MSSPALPTRIAAMIAVAAAAVVSLALEPALSRGESLSSIQSRLGSARGKLERVHARERVLTTDIAALSSRIRSLQREVGALRRREIRVASTL
jgi:septal ring factor EnvC (AmiA/AmiB activator)